MYKQSVNTRGQVVDVTEIHVIAQYELLVLCKLHLHLRQCTLLTTNERQQSNTNTETKHN
jgi:hypothetical protein